MDPRKISDSLSVSPQIAPDDVAKARALGFRAIVQSP